MLLLITDSLNRIKLEDLKLKELCNELDKLNIEYIVKEYVEIINNIADYKNYYVFYVSSLLPEQKSYIDDILFFLKEDNILIPSYELFRCHENKLFQELYKNNRNVDTLKTFLFNARKELSFFDNTINFPLIVKDSFGTGSRTVSKVKSAKELLNHFENKKYNVSRFKQKVYNKFRSNSIIIALFKAYIKIFKRHKKSGELLKYIDFESSLCKTVLQESVEDLSNDWKVIMFYNKIFVLYRGVKKNDFRASGMGLLDFDKKPPSILLDYVTTISKQLDIPIGSFDIVVKDNKCYLIEYQAVDFGLTTIKYAKRYYEQDNSMQWIEKQDIQSSEFYFAYAINKIINK